MLGTLYSCRMRLYQPSPALSPWVSGYEIMESGALNLPFEIWPDVNPVLGFQFRGRIRLCGNKDARLLDTGGITGLLTQPRLFQNLPHTGSVLVRFHPWGAAAFISEPMHRLAEVSAGLEGLMPRSALHETEERLQDAKDDASRIAFIEGFLLASLRARRPDGALRQGLRRILQGISSPHLAQDEHASISVIAGQVGLSERQLERKFKEWVGLSPKRFARVARFRAALSRLQAFSQSRLQSMLMDGYYDQAHFIREFQSMAGMTPGAYLRSRFLGNSSESPNAAFEMSDS